METIDIKDEMKNLKYINDCIDIALLLEKKDSVYGDSVKKTYNEWGILSFIIRMEDKINRIKQIVKNPQIDTNDEKLEDSIKDLAGYCILASSQLREKEKEENNALVKHSIEELNILLNNIKDDKKEYEMQKAFNDGIINIIKSFSAMGHSGLSANVAISYLEKLLRFKPLTQLNFTDDEWIEIEKGVFQNKRASNVFKEKDKFNGEPFCLDGPNGETVSLVKYPYAYVGNYITKEEIEKRRKIKEEKLNAKEN